MILKKVVNRYSGEEQIIDYDEKIVNWFSNEKKEIYYIAPEFYKGEKTGFYITFVEKGTINDVEIKMNTWNSKFKFMYAKMVKFNKDKNDPERIIWNRLVNFVKENESKFFTKKGDFRKKFLIDLSDIQKMLKKNK